MNVGERLRILISKCFFFFFENDREDGTVSLIFLRLQWDPHGRDGRESVWSDCSQILSEFILFRRDNYWKWIGRARNCSNSLRGKMSKSPLICRIVETLWDLELERKAGEKLLNFRHFIIWKKEFIFLFIKIWRAIN